MIEGRLAGVHGPWPFVSSRRRLRIHGCFGVISACLSECELPTSRAESVSFCRPLFRDREAQLPGISRAWHPSRIARSNAGRRLRAGAAIIRGYACQQSTRSQSPILTCGNSCAGGREARYLPKKQTGGGVVNFTASWGPPAVFPFSSAPSAFQFRWTNRRPRRVQVEA